MLRKIEKVILSTMTCMAIMAATFGSFIDYDEAYASNNDITYMKYTYSTKKFTEYDLPELSVSDNDGLNTRAAFLPDNRENSPLEKQLVQVGAGTGFIIGDHEVMTAAHVVTNLDTKQIDKPTVRIAKSNPLNTSTAVNLTPLTVTFPKDAYNEIDGNDYAIITVSEDLSQYGSVFLGLGVKENAIKKNNVYILGYKGNYQKISSGKIENVEEDVYITSAHAYYGTSGGPLYCQYEFGVQGSTDADEKVQTYKTVIGITSKVYGYTDSTTGEWFSGSTTVTRITPEILPFAYNNDNL
ncbi:MAG: trypsin-like serine peptidase [Porcipelethomonas sp.]